MPFRVSPFAWWEKVYIAETPRAGLLGKAPPCGRAGRDNTEKQRRKARANYREYGISFYCLFP